MSNETVKIEYTASVMVSAGWRSVTIEAEAEKTSEKMAKVVKILAIDGEEPYGYKSRTGAKRQTYNASGIARREEGKTKRLSACTVL